MTDLFEHASFGSALLFVTPMAGAYGALRLILPIAPDWTMRILAVASLLTALYASGMALVQSESRRYFCYLFLSNSSLVLVGLETATPAALTGGLCVWLSVSLSLAGLGFTLRSVESRMGRLSLRDYHGLYEHTPTLAWLFLLTGLASVGFPGTIGFIANELLVDGLIHQVPLFGVVVVLVAAINGISILQVYFRLFTGKRHSSSISLKIQLPEQVAVLVLAAVVLGAGLVPQPFLSSRFHAANQLMERRQPDSVSNPSNSAKLDQQHFHSETGSQK
jgi:NADH-quinone oxidoreductase subunit M